MEILEPGHFYHIYNRGNNKEVLFHEHSDYLHFLELYKKYLFDITEAYCFCLVPNHFHFVLRMKEKSEIESFENKNKAIHRFFSNFFNAYSKYFNHKYDRTGSLFQERFKRKRVDSEIYLKHLIQYIHTNPAHHEVSDDFTKYKYSSYQIHLSKTPTILKRAFVIDLFEDVENYIFVHKEKSRTMLIQNLIKGD